jgi:hypothetical protein
MPTKDDMRWFKQNFHAKIEPALQGTPFTLDLLTALACQESGSIWPILRKKNLPLDRILELCVGDTLDGRSVFPRSRAELESVNRGDQMFAIAHKALVDMSQFVPGFGGVAKNKNKFCHGYGIFQFDIQHFKTDPEYFLEKRYADFDHCLSNALRILQAGRKGIGFQNKATLTDREQALVAVAYNIGPGAFRPERGLKQGHRNSPNEPFYGELVFNFLTTSKTVTFDGAAPTPTPTPTPTPATAGTTPAPNGTGKLFRVDVKTEPLNLRSEPRKDPNNPKANVIARLPKGHIVNAVSDQPVNGFLEVRTRVGDEDLQGFASADFLKPAN